MLPGNTTSPRSGLNAIVAMTINYLGQIAEKVERIDEEQLRNLDENVMKYVENRNLQRKPILDDLENETLTIDNLNIANLNLLHNEAQCAILDLDQELAEFEKIRDNIQEQNNRALRDFIISSCGAGGIGVGMAGGQLTSRSGQMTSRSRTDFRETEDTPIEVVGEVHEMEERGSGEKA